ncbi:astacin (Peptidase family m12A) domain-containing protein [Ditylenchus destructor]|uniref:Metalloendopeptidase n=1 Tax=Ditylenchus destructor TaxID=166010 RepID=A0AAD4RDQ1_9BILA|nr:astacin (Peptidase family m12A) domain-containing protein [Ditylenchus destructor]
MFPHWKCHSLPSISHEDVVNKTAEPKETALSPMDFLSVPETEIDLRKLGIEVAEDPTLGSKAEGDIAVPNLKTFMDAQTNGLARNSIRQPYRKWPNNEIPYALSSQYGTYSRSIIAKAMNEYHTKTCIRFVARDPRRHNDYVYIHPDDGCYSLVGRVGGRQPLSLDSGCIQVGTIVHELMHTVGFFHEQSRYDREQFIQILWTNVVNGADDQFEKYGVNVIDQLNEPYDYASIMHYGPYAFSANGRRTIVPRRAGAERMGQRIQFSDIDLRKINKLYQCGLQSVATTNSVTDNSRLHGLSVAPSPQTVQEKGPCEDVNWRCIFWSLPVFGYCEKFDDIREKVCPMSCGTCEPPEEHAEEPTECNDKSIVCEEIDINNCALPLTNRICRRKCNRC